MGDGMKVLVTGGLGYIGSHCVKALLNAGHQVIIFDSGTPRPDLGAHCVQGDIRNRHDLEKVCQSTAFDAVMHFAAKIEVKESEENPGLYYENNVLGSINILETMRKHAIKNIVFSSTAAVYGDNPNVPLKETEIPNPVSVYGKSKLIIEQMLHEYHRAYDFHCVIFRYFNAAGASTDASIGENHQPESHLIPILIKKALTSQAITVNGQDFPTPDGTAVRDYIHVQDLAQAHKILGFFRLKES
jgi:UDP-glucose 4-epimerase